MKVKYLFRSMLAMAGVFAATSCSQEELYTETEGDFVEASFTIETPDAILSRAIGDGTTVDQVTCAVFDANGEEMDLRKDIAIVGKKAQYNVRLAKGQAYRVAFFAYDKDANAYDVSDMKNIQVLGNQASNLENRDAFTAKFDVTPTTATIKETVTLYRPFAQLNLGAYKDDVTAAAAAGIVVTNTQVTVSNVYTAFSAYDDAVVGGTSEMTFALNAIPTQDLEVDINRDNNITADEKFAYLALNYILVGDKGSEKSLADIKFTWKTADGKTNNPISTFENIPVQRNYRTNIVGWLLTNPAEFNIVIDEEFTNSPKEDYVVSIWDGKSTTTPNADASGVYHITSAAEFVGILNDSKYPNCNKYQTLILDTDIDFAGHTISGFGDESGFFDGTFDGQGHTISNFKIDATNRTYYAGLFNQVSQYSGENTVIKNLIVKDATVAGSGQVGVIVGGMNGNTIVENCKVYNSTVSAVKKVGSVVGYTAGGTVKDCYAENCTIVYTEKEAGEILGYENTGSTVTNNTFSNIVFKPTAEAFAKEFAPVNGVINITRDYILSSDWTSLKFSGAITINGNGHTISKLTQPLLAGNAASELTFNDLTIADSNIGIAAVENALGTGAFISYLDAQKSVAFNNCHLVNSSVTGNERAAGLIAYSSATTSVSIKDCSVVDCDITAVGGVAGFIAYSSTPTEIVDSNVEISTIVSTEDRTGKTALAGAIIGTVGGATTLTNANVDNATVVTNTNATPYSKKVGRIVGGTLTEN